MEFIPLGVSDPNAVRGQARFTNECPYCRQFFGSSSFAIHEARCRHRDKLNDFGPEQNYVAVIPSLLELATRVLSRNLDGSCYNSIVTQASEQAELLSFLPNHITQKIIVALISRNKRLKRVQCEKSFKLLEERVRKQSVVLNSAKIENRILRENAKKLQARNNTLQREATAAQTQARRWRLEAANLERQLEKSKLRITAQLKSRQKTIMKKHEPKKLKTGVHPVPNRKGSRIPLPRNLPVKYEAAVLQ